MNYTDRQGLTEDAPLTRGRIKGFRFNCSEDGGLKMTVICFTVLSIAITVALGLQLIYNDNVLQGRRHGAVATDFKDCSEIGTSILRKGGNAVDAAIAATICMTVASPYKTGLGGGGYAMIYSHENRDKPVIIDFATNTVQGALGKIVRVPSLLKGLAVAHSLHGNLPWEELVLPSTKLAKEGFIVTNEFVQEIERNPIFIDLYGQLEPGHNLTLPKLSKTLDIIAKRGADELYNGSLSQQLFGKPSPEVLRQLANYQPEIKSADVINFYEHLVYYPPGASVLENALRMINELKISQQNASTIDSLALLADTLIKNKGNSRDDSSGFNERYSSVVVMDGVDSYVVIITGLSTAFGSGRMTGAGFLMDSPESNLAQLTPVLFCDAVSICGLRGIIGADDVTLTSELIYNLMVRKLNVTASVENPRYYLLQDGISIEKEYPHEMDPKLEARLNLLLNPSNQNADQLLKSCNAIIKIKDIMNSHSDSRGGGYAARFRY